MTEEELLAAFQKVVRAEIALERAKMKAYVDARLHALIGAARGIDREELTERNSAALAAEKRLLACQ